VSRNNYSVRGLIDEPSFRRMVKGTATPQETERWSTWMEASDQNRQKAKAAMSQIAGFEFREPSLPDVGGQWGQLYKKTVGQKKVRPFQRRSNPGRLNWLFRIAAVMVLTSMVGLGVYYFSDDEPALTHLEEVSEETTIVTGAGEQKTLRFSNGARVVLNSYSRLTYSVENDQNIQVALGGEAWFETGDESTDASPSFVVHTPEGMIRNIGTKFLVTVQEEQSRVVLQEGVVEIKPVGHHTYTDDEMEKPVYRVEKGEMVEFTRSDILRRERVNPTFYTAWATQYMEFDQTGLTEFAKYIEQRFEVTAVVNNPDLEGILLDGAVYFRSLDELVRSVSEVTGISVYRSAERDTVYIGRLQ
jgi:ferric-dicitrate binding protein FerR (iron transport regulator)